MPPPLRLLLLAALLAAFPAAAFDQTHARWGRVLESFLSSNRVDYAALKAKPADLDAYLAEVAGIPAAEFAGWPRADRLALLLNLYNAATLRLIADHHPVRSIRSLGTLPGAAWRMPVVRFGGQLMTLDHLEHRIIRAEYAEPRIHFALVCAAVSCPPLRPEPYTGARLEAQLGDQTRLFLAETDKNRFDAATGTLHLSPIFQWFKEDFTAGGGTLESFVAPHLPPEAAEALQAAKRVRVKFTAYDWALNGR
ncbi:MAG TPA: DUF547 domain-containing protein [Verrucomicrobiota bacterium]|nr:DUF547 domain-containing protein [Verrucomicrobiota bacterium]